jgi:LmbE family N-acetylglucosaminyl deacetylase
MQLLKRLNTTASALMIGAHPDDEDTALLAYLARGENARTAYLSLTRGDGGQNIIGTELGEALGVIRTEELLQARRLDGAEQFFTRAYDYGFSKTLDEAKSKWDEKIILCDVVRVIRNFRPLVVISQFSGTSADGHGQHQFAGYISPIAVKAAADAAQCTNAGPVWTVKKFYQRHRGQGEPTLRINTGKYDPLLGRSYFEIAMEARSQHKSQEQGVLELRGDQFSSLNFQGSQSKEVGVFDGLDLSIRGVGKGVKDFEQPLSEIHELAEKARREFDAGSPDRVLRYLVQGYQLAHKAGLYTYTDTGYSPAAESARTMAAQFAEAVVAVLGLQLDALSEVETVAPGESFNVTVKAYSPLREAVQVKGITLAVPAKLTTRSVVNLSEMQWWLVTKRPPPTTNSPAFVSREVALAAEHFTVTVPPDAHLSTPYWLVDPRGGDMFSRSGHWQTFDLAGLQPLPMAWLTFEINGVVFSVNRPVEFRYADDVRGEIRRNVDVVPKLSVEMDQSLMIVPYSEKAQTRQLVMTVTNHSQQAVTGTASLNFNTSVEWKYAASSATFELRRTGEKAAITFDVTVPARTKAGSYQVSGRAMVGEALANMTMKTIAYPHIQTHRYYRPATVDAKVIDLKTAPSRVGYIVGSGDRVPEAIRQMGFDVEMISERDLARGDLSKFDTIVVGIRAYQVRPDVVANNPRLLDYARNGGTLIVQYQLPPYAQQNYAPLPAGQGPRVADENAKVTILAPDHPVFNTPNKITDADFAGWVQERNLYNFSMMDAGYTPLLESHDAGEAENKGGLVIAKVGNGNYIYCSYSMFRQLPAGVPGAYRLFANLLSLPKAK